MRNRQFLAPTRPSAAIESLMRRRLLALVDEMQKSIAWWLAIAYRAKPPEMAADAKDTYKGSPSVVMQRVMARLSRKWQKRFNEAAPDVARYFTTKIADRNENVLSTALKQSGFTVEMKLTAPVNDVLQASMAQQVLLIKDLGAQHLSDISGMVMRAVAQGGDLQTLSEGLQEQYGITQRRARLIARDQNSKATSTISRAQQASVGITEGIWRHSHAGKVPRRSHVKASGQVFNLKDGMELEENGKMIRTWPGVEINCRCFWKPVLPKLNSQGARS